MSLENAKKVLDEIKKDYLNGNNIGDLELYLKEKGYDCSIDELKKAAILSNELSDAELEKVSGGKYEYGNCDHDYYDSDCSFTVSPYDKCFWLDYQCTIFGNEYLCKLTASLCTDNLF